MKDDAFQTHFLRLQTELHRNLREMNDARKVLIYGLRTTSQLLGASEAAVAIINAGDEVPLLLHTIPRKQVWDLALLEQFLHEKQPATDHHTLLVPVRRRQRNWAVLALWREEKPFSRSEYHALFSIAQILTDAVLRVDRERLIRVRRKIERRIANREDPKDLMYNILHGLQSLTMYDHSASLFITKAGSEKLELVAEQIAWTKAKSRQIGRRIRVGEVEAQRLRDRGVSIYHRNGSGWYCVSAEKKSDGKAAILPRMLAEESTTDLGIPPEMAMLCAPIDTPDGALSVLKITACRPDVLGPYEAELIDSFMPLVSLVVQFSGQIESLREQVLRAERKHVLADMARATAHDVNHALGIVLPRVQSIRHDLNNDALDLEQLNVDLNDIELSVQTCRRIFDGMLAIARETHRGLGHGNVLRAVEQALAVLQDRVRRHTIEVDLDLPMELPTIRGRQGDITRLFLNICGNAIDAMPEGGRLEICVETGKGALRVWLSDNGSGIPDHVRPKVMEPFFSSKENGSGLGLAICRSILREMGGEIEIESQEGEGTRVSLVLPYLEEPLLEGV